MHMLQPTDAPVATRDVRPIETSYAGCRFRSRLEARWAVVFDRLGVAWEHEPQPYETPYGAYLPDFAIAIPAGMGYFDRWLFEVKPDGAPPDPRHGAPASAATEHRLCVARGLPRSTNTQGAHLTWLDHDGPLRVFFTISGYLELGTAWGGELAPVDAAYAAARSERFGT